VGVVVLGFVLVIVFVIALGWLAIVSRPKWRRRGGSDPPCGRRRECTRADRTWTAVARSPQNGQLQVREQRPDGASPPVPRWPFERLFRPLAAPVRTLP